MLKSQVSNQELTPSSARIQPETGKQKFYLLITIIGLSGGLDSLPDASEALTE
jgi:hypothetical protein